MPRLPATPPTQAMAAGAAALSASSPRLSSDPRSSPSSAMPFSASQPCARTSHSSAALYMAGSIAISCLPCVINAGASNSSEAISSALKLVMDSVADAPGEKRFSNRFITGSAASATSMPKNS